MHDILKDFYAMIGTPVHLVDVLTLLTHAGIAIAISVAVYFLCLKLISPIITKLVILSKMDWDEILLSPRILQALSLVVFAIVLHMLLPPACRSVDWAFDVMDKLCPIFLVFTWVRFFMRLFEAGYKLLARNERIKMQPLKGLLQMLQLIAIVVGVIICVSILLDRNPIYILSGLGASAAVLMLVFKDTILGVVAGVQLSANDMLQKGDWIVVPGTDVNGVVTDVTLTTVKVQNFDNTTVTVPPYSLVSGAFQNYRGMFDSGGRRIMRSVMIDVRSIRFCTEEEMAVYRTLPWAAKIDTRVDARPVNLTVFRAYLEDFIEKFSLTKRDYTFMVRHLQPTDTGVPLQLYCFTSHTAWKDYEHVQADLFDHIYAVIGQFGLRIYQAPTSQDVNALSQSWQPEKVTLDPALLTTATPAEESQPSAPEAPAPAEGAPEAASEAKPESTTPDAPSADGKS